MLLGEQRCISLLGQAGWAGAARGECLLPALGSESCWAALGSVRDWQGRGQGCPFAPSAALMTEQGGEEICQAEPGPGLNPHHRPWLSSGSIISPFVCLLNN